MTIIFLSIVLAFMASFALMWYANESYSTWSSFVSTVGVLGVMVALGTSTVFAYAAWEWQAAPHKAEILNREYGTAYTTEEIFWAEDVIETVKQLDRKRYEINGNILQTKPE